MPQKLRIFALHVGLSIGLVVYHPIFARDPCMDLVERNNFFQANHQYILDVGIKSWARWSKKVIEKHWALGTEVAIGPSIEWHPLNGIGFETGIFYSYNSLFTVNFSIDHKGVFDPSLFKFGDRLLDKINSLHAKDGSYIAYAGLGGIAFHAISIPLLFRFYPEKSRRFVCYAGPRLIWIFGGLAKNQYCPVHIDTADLKNICYGGGITLKQIADQRMLTKSDIECAARQVFSKIFASIFNTKTNTDHKEFISQTKGWIWDLDWDFGIEFKAKFGIVVGINALGIVLGYTFMK